MTDTIEALFKSRLDALAPISIEIGDDSALHAGHAGAGGGGHYRLRIVSESFRGKTTIQRHRLIYNALGDLMRCKIHALTILAVTPDEAS